MASASIISTAAGRMPSEMMSLTVPAASSTLRKPTSIVCTDSGTRTSRRVSSVATPRVPSLPMKAPSRS